MSGDCNSRGLWSSPRRLVLSAGALLLGLLAGEQAIDACTRCVYLGSDDIVVVGRSLDWVVDPKTNLFAFPRGLKRHGAAGPRSVEWTSKYGSVICNFYGCATIDGMNDQGLVANALYLVESDYGTPRPDQKTLSIAAYTQYVLDNFATVDEAVTELAKEKIALIAPLLPDGKPAHGHLAISDPSGDSAIFQYLNGKLHIHHGRQYQVMTNSPAYDQQLALNAYWEQIGGMAMLPGTNRAADRFVRTSFFIQAIPQTGDLKQAVAQVFSVIRGVSVPLGITTPGAPNIASTLWRTIHDQKNKVVYFDSATSPTVFWVPLSDLDLSAGAPVKMLPLSNGQTYNANAASQFVPAEPFSFLQAEEK
jgi:choloylglycine hydrolase